MSLIFVLLMIAGAGLIIYINSTSSTPQKTLNTSCNAGLQGDYQTAYNQFSRSDPQVPQSEQRYAQEVQNATQGRNGLRSCTVSNVNETGSSAAGLITLGYGNGTSERILVTLTDENGIWRISKATLAK
jgi:hypothetical protein